MTVIKALSVLIGRHAICGVFKRKGQGIDFNTAESTV